MQMLQYLLVVGPRVSFPRVGKGAGMPGDTTSPSKALVGVAIWQYHKPANITLIQYNKAKKSYLTFFASTSKSTLAGM
jgi:hypothetical protein